MIHVLDVTGLDTDSSDETVLRQSLAHQVDLDGTLGVEWVGDQNDGIDLLFVAQVYAWLRQHDLSIHHRVDDDGVLYRVHRSHSRTRPLTQGVVDLHDDLAGLMLAPAMVTVQQADQGSVAELDLGASWRHAVAAEEPATQAVVRQLQAFDPYKKRVILWGDAPLVAMLLALQYFYDSADQLFIGSHAVH